MAAGLPHLSLEADSCVLRLPKAQPTGYRPLRRTTITVSLTRQSSLSPQ